MANQILSEACDTVPIFEAKALNHWVKHNHIVPHNLWDPFEGDQVILGRLLTVKRCVADLGGNLKPVG